ncbi:MAG: tryptophan synthase subunit alpha [Enterococcus sp.]
MKSLTTTLGQKKSEGTKLFIPYIMAGANGLETLEAEIKTLAANGATAIEIGVPFSDPVADGPVIQAAGLLALHHGVTFKKIIQTLQGIDSPVPLILMGYANSFFHYGLEALVTDLQTTDVKAWIIPDVPYEHRELILPSLEETDIVLIQLISLTSPQERIEKLVQEAQGFVYAVTINGTTGTGKDYRQGLDEHLASIAKLSPVPVVAGFGVSSREHVERFNQACDGVVVGSKIVKTLQAEGVTGVTTLMQELTRK